MIDEEQIKLEIAALKYRIADTTDCIRDYKKKIIKLRQQKKELRKQLLYYQQLLWKNGGEE